MPNLKINFWWQQTLCCMSTMTVCDRVVFCRIQTERFLNFIFMNFIIYLKSWCLFFNEKLVLCYITVLKPCFVLNVIACVAYLHDSWVNFDLLVSITILLLLCMDHIPKSSVYRGPYTLLTQCEMTLQRSLTAVDNKSPQVVTAQISGHATDKTSIAILVYRPCSKRIVTAIKWTAVTIL